MLQTKIKQAQKIADASGDSWGEVSSGTKKPGVLIKMPG